MPTHVRPDARTRRRQRPLSARILFVAEAPGLLGAHACGLPLSGDRTGRTFDELLTVGGVRRSDIFLTNTVLCDSRDEAGRNARPSRAEMANCRRHLAWLIALLDPRWVVTLGVVALEAMEAVAQHGAILRHDVGQPILWSGRQLVPLYHSGPRALIHRPLATQGADYARLSAIVAAPHREEAGLRVL